MKKLLGMAMAAVAALAFGMQALADDSPASTSQEQTSTDKADTSDKADTVDKTDKSASAGAASPEPAQNTNYNKVREIAYTDQG